MAANNLQSIKLTEAGEMFLLACATMGGMPPFGRGSSAMVRRLRRDGLIAEKSDECVCTGAGRRPLADAGYAMGGVAS